MKNRGFTVLELLVVVAIIGILAAVTLALLSDTRARSRDAKRLSDMREIEKAINLYYAENGNFPVEETEITITGEDDLSGVLEGASLISEVPADPLHDSYTYRYQSFNSGSDFTLTFCLETDTIQGYNADCNNTIKP